MSLYEGGEPSFKDTITINCMKENCINVVTDFCVKCKNWYCEDHITKHTCIPI